MKLVDILARELKAWPEGIHKLAQSFAGMVFYQDSAQQIVPLGRMEISDDFRDEHVTRAEWQAAVDALNAPKVVEWDGVSLPYSGSSLEYKTTDAGEHWCKAVVKFVGTHFLLVGYQHPDLGLSEAGINHAMLDGNFSGLLRKIRTAEQIASEEREKVVSDMWKVVSESDGYEVSEMQALYDAGYRKGPKPCGS